MRVDELVRSLTRRPVALLLVVLIGALGAAYGYKTASSTYESRAVVLIIPPTATDGGPGTNPLVNLDYSISQLALTVSTTTPGQTTWIIVSAALWLLERRPAIPWIVAPVAVGNPGPARMLTASGFEQAAVARQLRVYAGVPTDHDIWRLENTPTVRERLRVLASA